MRVFAIVGMAGAGKSEAALIFKQEGYAMVRFGDVTDEEIVKRGLVINEENERLTREALRKEYGMAAYAILNRPKIDRALERGPVVIDGLYSWEEYKSLKSYYEKKLAIVAILTSPQTRHFRLASRKIRPLNADEAMSRDSAEIENLNKGGPIAMADYNVINEGSLAELARQIKQILSTAGRE
ncbi:MAG: AAA family ATPase [Dehalococcoidales bacterium]|nr:AAA family ATPase [Dehalococcoidales bacterium]MDD3264523.1 AAA family ATPase [Dehalococcoidales bacterium]MDD4322198.1 AAA family ATPase [Dehalococcoidales bacterium]MDD4794470.1 AAA family ATPase [Dehalococcoidales bacterium]MDD5122203.1 AAA family ATPase [Dehalococcoidales bacterium]